MKKVISFIFVTLCCSFCYGNAPISMTPSINPVTSLILVGLLVGEAISVTLASDNFGELNIKAGLNLTSVKRIDFLRNQIIDAERLNPCVSFCGEYLISAERLVSNLNFLKVGLRLKYLSPSEFKIKNTSIPNFKLSFFPIYFTTQANPFIKPNKEVLWGCL